MTYQEPDDEYVVTREEAGEFLSELNPNGGSINISAQMAEQLIGIGKEVAK